jgi:hypothetical protein
MMKTRELNLAQVEVTNKAGVSVSPSVAAIEGSSPMRREARCRRLARTCAIAVAVALLPARYAMADDDDRNQQILPFPTLVETTVPGNGDVNPYGVAFVPHNFPVGGLLNPWKKSSSPVLPTGVLPETTA